jgi:lysophospholipase L1-like esterase
MQNSCPRTKLKLIAFLSIGITIPFLFSLIVLELIFGNWFNSNSWIETQDLNIVRDSHLKFEIDTLYSGYGKVSTYTRDKYGLRQNCPNGANIDVLTIGGSTTDQRFISDELTWQSHLQNEISHYLDKNICVSNAGVDGHSTFGHLEAFRVWFPKIPNLKPKLVLLYLGINDAGFRFTPLVDFDLKNNLNHETHIQAVLRERSALYRLLKQLRDFLKSDPKPSFTEHKGGQFRLDAYDAYRITDGANGLAVDNAQAFSKRLDKILTDINEMGGVPVCISQPNLHAIQHDGKLAGVHSAFVFNGMTYNGLDYDQSIKLLNKAMAQRCVSKGGFYIDMASREFSFTDFYDLVHMNPTGTRKLSNFLFTELVKQNVLRYLK